MSKRQRLTSLIMSILFLWIGIAGCNDSSKQPLPAFQKPLPLSPVSSPAPPPFDYTDPELPQRLDQALDAWRTDYDINGAAAQVTCWGWFNWAGGSGEANVEQAIPYEYNTRGRIASASKPFTSTVVLQLIDEGLLSLDTKMSEFFPDYPNSEAITIEHLLRHRSGIPDVVLMDLWFIMTAFFDREHWFTPEEILEWTYKVPLPIISIREDPMAIIPREPMAEPGGNFHYSQPGYIALGRIIELITQKELADVYLDRIIGPLGLENTYLPQKDDPPDPIGYTNLFGLLTLMKPILDPFNLQPDKQPTTNFFVENANSLVSGGWAAGGLVSTGEDLATFLSAMLQGLLFSEESLEKATDWLAIEPGDIVSSGEYGMGLMKIENSDYVYIGHDGALPGGGSVMKYLPDFDVYIGAVINTDRDWNTGKPDLVERIINALLDEESDVE